MLYFILDKVAAAAEGQVVKYYLQECVLGYLPFVRAMKTCVAAYATYNLHVKARF